MEVKDIIRNKRIELGLSMKELADKVGVTEGTISRWESGNIANMRRDKIVALANALGVSPALIMGWEEEQPKQRYYLDDETAAAAQELFGRKEMRVLFDAARGARASDIDTAADMLDVLKKRERYDGDDPA